MNNKLFRILACSILLLAVACQDKGDVVREEYIRFYSDKDLSKEISVLQIPFEGDSAKIVVTTNNDVNFKFEMPESEKEDPWISFSDPVQIKEGVYEVTYVAASLLKDLDQRTASVNVTAPNIWLGRFLRVCQGYPLFWTPASDDAVESITFNTSWKSGELTGIEQFSHAYLSFNAYALAQQSRTFQLEISLTDGAVFTETGLSSYVIDVECGEEFNWSNLVALPFKSSGSAFLADMKVSLRLLTYSQVTIYVDNFKIYNVADDLLDEGDGEEFVDPEAGESGDLE